MDSKPISVQIEEARNYLATVINDLKMNPYLLEPILKDLYDAIVIAKNQQYQKDRALLEEAQMKKGGTDGKRSKTAGKD